jgi:hypothetical protein
MVRRAWFRVLAFPACGGSQAHRRVTLDVVGHDVPCPIRRTVVGDDDLELAGVITAEHVIERLGNGQLLVVGGHHQRDGREGTVEIQWPRPVNEDRADQLDVQVAGDERDPRDDDHGQGHGDVVPKRLDPCPGEPEREPHPEDPEQHRAERAKAERYVEAAVRRGGGSRGPLDRCLEDLLKRGGRGFSAGRDHVCGGADWRGRTLMRSPRRRRRRLPVGAPARRRCRPWARRRSGTGPRQPRARFLRGVRPPRLHRV